MTTDVGRIAALWRYPVKAMAGESLERASVSWFGLAGDRRWAFVRDGQERNGFPWLTIRERPTMGQVQPRLLEPDRPDASPTEVTTPDGETFDIADPRLIEALGGGARLIKQNRGAFDTFPLSLISAQTIAALGGTVGAPLDVQRFRPNLLVEATGEAAFPEDDWVGRVVRIGGARVRIDKRDQRCMVVNVDPRTGERDPAVLRAIASTRDACLGVYGQIVEPGEIAVGDAVVLES